MKGHTLINVIDILKKGKAGITRNWYFFHLHWMYVMPWFTKSCMSRNAL